MLGILGGVKEINTKVKHGRCEVAEGGTEGGILWYQNIEREVMEVDGQLVVHGGQR